MKDTIVSGIRATGKLHIGNYLGALKQFVELQNSGHNCFFFIADLHALTTPFEPAKLSADTLEVAADYLAAGIDPEKSAFFLQSQVLEHTELGWIFNSLTPLGELQRMTQFKDKSSAEGGSASGGKHTIMAGLLTYPTLMAADILLYKPTAVPVGEDQIQHVELTRDTARKFNNRFGQTFPEPKTFMREPLRIMSLTDPTKKMSKTGDEALMLDDEPEEILRKLKKAVTATDGSQKSSGVENLFQILKHFAPESEYQNFITQQNQGSIKYSELKETLATRIAEHFQEFRAKKKELLANPEKIRAVLALGKAKAEQTAQVTLAEVKKKIGLL